MSVAQGDGLAAPALSRRVSRRRLLAGCAGVAALALIGGRIGYVNATSPFEQIVEHHAMGEKVDLSGTFCATRSLEALDGYSLTVKSAALRSYNEYIGLHAIDGSEPIEGLDIPAIVDLEWEIENVGNEDGQLRVFSMTLTPERANTYYIVESNLLKRSQKALLENTYPVIFNFGIRPDTTYELSVPYGYNGAFHMEGEEKIWDAWTYEMPDRRFELRLSNYPVRHVVDIEL